MSRKILSGSGKYYMNVRKFEVRCRILWVVTWVLFTGPKLAFGQIVGSSLGPEYHLSNDVRVNEAETAVRGKLAQIRAAIVGGQTANAVEMIREVVSKSGDHLVNATADMKGVPPRFISVREYCQLILTRLPTDALTSYRRQIDPTCRVWLETGLRDRDPKPLERLVDQELASSYADAALWWLGEWAIQDGHPGRARGFWRQLLPPPLPARDLPTWRAVPDTEYSPAAVRARLILCTILEGSLDQAKRELAEFKTLHSGERGRFAGQEVEYAVALEKLIDDAAQWLPRPEQSDWPTFARTINRSSRIPTAFDSIKLIWRAKLPSPPKIHTTLWSETAAPEMIREKSNPLCYHPIVKNGRVFVPVPDGILGFDLPTGKPLWSASEGYIFHADPQGGREVLIPVNTIGALNWTVAAHDKYLLARVGSPVSIIPGLLTDAVPQPNALVCLNCEEEAKLEWKLDPPEPGWAFEGSPLLVHDRIYVVMRRSDVPSHLYLACLSVDRGNFLWRQFICAADTPGRSFLYEMTHVLPTRGDNMIYLVTNLGAVAAVSETTGEIRWITCYPRLDQGDLSVFESFRYREPNPALYWNGMLFVAPTDSRQLFALDAFSGMIIWVCPSPTERIRHLLGVVDGRLIATGDRVYWIETDGNKAGQIVAQWPHGAETLGWGRGLIAGKTLYWPTRDAIYRINASTAQPEAVFPLRPWGCEGGHLVWAEGYLLLTSSTELAVFQTTPITTNSAFPPHAASLLK
ncbi:MAG: outer membrane protein assembly factor BamB family protein [Thermogutta sp.]